MNWRQGFLCTILAVALVACPPPPPVVPVVGVTGGTVTASDNSTKVTFPANSLTADTPVTLSAVANPAPPAATEKLVPNTVFAIGGGTGNFAQPASLEIKIDPSTIPSANGKLTTQSVPPPLIACVYNGTAWVLVQGFVFNPSTNIGTIPIAGFGTYAIFSSSTIVVTSITLNPTTANIVVGATQQFTAVARNASGAAISPQPTFTWASNNTNATVNTSGLATAVAVGSSSISASANGVTGSAALTISASAATIAQVEVSPTSANISLGQTQQFIAIAKDANGVSVNPQPTFVWSSSNGNAGVNNAGLATGLGIGTSTIKARVNTSPNAFIEGTATLTIAAVNALPTARVAYDNQTISLFTGTVYAPVFQGIGSGAAIVYGTDRTPQFTPVTWNSSSPNVATVVGGTQATISPFATPAAITAVAVGTTQITASADGQTSNAQLVHVVSSPTQVIASRGIGGGNQFQVIVSAQDTNGITIIGLIPSDLICTSANTSIATVAPLSPNSGFGCNVTRVADGTVDMTASIRGVVSNAVSITFNTTPPVQTLGSLTISPANFNMLVGSSFGVLPAQRDTQGRPMISPVTNIIYVSSNPNVATISTSGSVTAVAAGTTEITASVGAVVSNALQVTVVSAAAGFRISSSGGLVGVGNQSNNFVALPVDANGNGLGFNPQTNAPTWSSSNPAVADFSTGSNFSSSVTGYNVSVRNVGVGTTTLSVSGLGGATASVVYTVVDTLRPAKIGLFANPIFGGPGSSTSAPTDDFLVNEVRIVYASPLSADDLPVNFSGAFTVTSSNPNVLQVGGSIAQVGYQAGLIALAQGSADVTFQIGDVSRVHRYNVVGIPSGANTKIGVVALQNFQGNSSASGFFLQRRTAFTQVPDPLGAVGTCLSFGAIQNQSTVQYDVLSGVGIDAGATIGVSSGNGILFGVPRVTYSFAASLNYAYGLFGGFASASIPPNNVTVSVPGATFPALSNVVVPAAPNITINNDLLFAGITKDTVITWSGGSAGRLQILATFGDGFAARGYSCIADASTGSFSFPANIKSEITTLFGNNAIGGVPSISTYNSAAQSSGDATLITLRVGVVSINGLNAGASARSSNQDSFWKSFMPAFAKLGTR
jgi:uncharacterized protein YjdB